MDFFIDNMVKKSIINIIEHNNTIPDDIQIWKSLTRLMFKYYPEAQINLWIREISEEAYNNNWFENKYEEEEFKRRFVNKPIKPSYKKKIIGDYPLLRPDIEQIISKVSIIEIADKYDLKPLGKNMRICPFHNDSNPSLSLNNEKGLFHCFSCNESGNIVKFRAMLKKLKGDINGRDN